MCFIIGKDKKHYDLREPLAHGDILFPLYIYNISSNARGVIFHYQWHDEIEFLFQVEGKAVIYINTVPYELHPGQALIVNSGDLHCGFHPDNSFCRYYAVVFSPEILFSRFPDTCQSTFITGLIQKKFALPNLISQDIPWQRDILHEISDITSSFNDKLPGYELAVKASLFKIFSKLIAHNAILTLNESHFPTQSKIDRLKTVIQYIQKNYNKKISISDLAGLVNMSQFHFCRLFKAALDKSPLEYINYYRVSHAAAMLREDNKKVIEIAQEVGFESLSHFIKIFKQHLKCTPSEFRTRSEK